MQEYIDKIYRKEALFSKIALQHVRMMDSLFTRLTRRYSRYEPAIQHEATRLIKVAIVLALGEIENPTPEHRRVSDALVWYLYDSEIDEVTRAFKEYGDDKPSVEFCKSVWRITGAPTRDLEDFEFFRMCCIQVQRQLDLVIGLFVSSLNRLTQDPNRYFYTFIDSLPPVKK